jgi:hypothetical protein
MRPSVRLHHVLAALLFASGGFVARGQEDSPPCPKDGSDFIGQCSCIDPPTYRGEYRDERHGYQVRLPDGVVAMGNCGQKASGFRVNASQPDKPNLAGSEVVVGVTYAPQSLTEIANRWLQKEREDNEKDPLADIEVDQPTQTSLSSLPAVNFKETKPRSSGDKMVYEEVFAKDFNSETAYVITLISPAESYEKSHKLFKAIVEGFTYIPNDHGDSR